LSSILRALKKLESEPQLLDKSQGTDHKYISLAGPDQRSSTYRPLLLFIGGGIACGMVLLSGWWFMHESPQPDIPSIQESPNSVSTMDTPKIEPEKAVSTKSETPSPATEQEQPASQPSALLAPAEQTSQPVASSVPADSQIEPISPDLPETPATIIPDQTPIVETAPVPDEAPEEQISPEPTAKEEIIATAAVLPETPAQTKEPEIPLLRDPDVKLQSISWSKNPTKRLAVISNRIVREGEMASGYLLVTINKDDVILSQNRKKWRINFRIK
jgi:hypothetical protein